MSEDFWNGYFLALFVIFASVSVLVLYDNYRRPK